MVHVAFVSLIVNLFTVYSKGLTISTSAFCWDFIERVNPLLLGFIRMSDNNMYTHHVE